MPGRPRRCAVISDIGGFSPHVVAGARDARHARAVGLVELYEGSGRCPGCNEVHYVDGQTQLFVPYGAAKTYRVAEPQMSYTNPGIFTSKAWEQWWRLRPPVKGTNEVAVLHWIEDVFECSCDRVLAPVLRFAIEPASVCLKDILMVDMKQPGFEREIDFVGEWVSDPQRVAELAELPFDERIQWVRDRVAARRERSAHPGWTVLVGPTQCESCGDVRERTHTTLFTDPNLAPTASLFGPQFTGRTIFLGDRVRVATDWQPVVHHYSVLSQIDATMTVLSKLQSFGCACGAGRAAVVQKFACRGSELELVELGLRVVRSTADLSDVDVVEGKHPFGLAAIVGTYR